MSWSRDYMSIDIDQGDEGGDTDSNKTEVNILEAKHVIYMHLSI